MMRAMKVVIAGTVVIVTACTSAPTTNAPPMSRQQLRAELTLCTQTHGYDPERTVGVAENAIAANELPWRQCAYEAVRAYAKGNPSLNDLYAQLINEDIEMTAAIQQGSLTRSERRARIEELLAQIRAAEDFQIQAGDNQGSGGQSPSQAQQERNHLDNVVANIRGFY
jgi:hypothetical protein